MAGKSKYDVETVRQWRVMAKSLRPNYHLTRGKISLLVAREFHVPAGTVWYYVFGNGRTKARYNSVRRDKHYDLAYHQLIRHLDAVLPTLYNGNPELSLTEITTRIETHKGISMRESTLENLLGKYESKERGPLLVKTESGNYRLNHNFYQTH